MRSEAPLPELHTSAQGISEKGWAGLQRHLHDLGLCPRYFRTASAFSPPLLLTWVSFAHLVPSQSPFSFQSFPAPLSLSSMAGQRVPCERRVVEGREAQGCVCVGGREHSQGAWFSRRYCWVPGALLAVRHPRQVAPTLDSELVCETPHVRDPGG